MPEHFSKIGIALVIVLALAIDLVTFVVSPLCTMAAAAKSPAIGTVMLIGGCRPPVTLNREVAWQKF